MPHGYTLTKRQSGTNPRALGTNPRATGTNPRVLGTNPLARHPKPFEPNPEHEAHNVRAIAACRAQLEAGEIDADDFEWLTGEKASPDLAKRLHGYLVPSKLKHRAHLWTGRDTLCRMASTGGLKTSKYRVEQSPMGRAVCQICASRL